jgi:class 3 adenylate cyclase
MNIRSWFASKKSDDQPALPAPFTGIGTVMLTDVSNFAQSAQGMTPTAIAAEMNRHLESVLQTVRAHGGEVSQQVGSACIACWRDVEGDPPGQHARRAYAASQEIITSLSATPNHAPGSKFAVRIDLGSGELAGQTFGPIKQFQVVGIARAVADRISRHGTSPHSIVRMSQYTRQLLDDTEDISEAGSLAREGLENLRVFEWLPVRVRA